MTKIETSTKEVSQITVGSTVWAPIGTYGWRPAIVLSLKKTNARVNYIGTRYQMAGQITGEGTRKIADLVARDEAKGGADKPKAKLSEIAILKTVNGETTLHGIPARGQKFGFLRSAVWQMNNKAKAEGTGEVFAVARLSEAELAAYQSAKKAEAVVEKKAPKFDFTPAQKTLMAFERARALKEVR